MATPSACLHLFLPRTLFALGHILIVSIGLGSSGLHPRDQSLLLHDIEIRRHLINLRTSASTLAAEVSWRRSFFSSAPSAARCVVFLRTRCRGAFFAADFGGETSSPRSVLEGCTQPSSTAFLNLRVFCARASTSGVLSRRGVLYRARDALTDPFRWVCKSSADCKSAATVPGLVRYSIVS